MQLEIVSWGCKVVDLSGTPAIEVENFSLFLAAFGEQKVMSLLNGASLKVLSNSLGRSAVRDGLSFDAAANFMISRIARKFDVRTD